jgi:tryptophan-rich sensory protein/uncharacterized protein YbjT (DUF2867 family)
MILLTGATGYVGRRLLAALRGRAVRCLARRPEAVDAGPEVEVVPGDVLDPVALRAAMRGVAVAYYLVHSMGTPGDFAERDRAAARGFGEAARDAGVRRIVYLGGLGRGPDLSEHLASRHEVGRILAESGVPVVELRTSVIVGAGSLPFEMARKLVEKLPVMVTPRWVRTLTQPIGIDDVVAYLVEAADAHVGSGGGIFEVGGADAVSYGDLMREIARQRGLRRWMLRVPVLSPGLSSRWLSLVTPREAGVGRSLIEGVRNETTVQGDAARRTFAVRPLGLAESVRRALAETPPPRPAHAGSGAAAGLFAFLLVCLGVGALGSLANATSITTWYPSLVRPAWTPPDAVFGPVWTALYVAMAVAAWRVWSRDGVLEARLPLGLFATQLALNGTWSWIFFGARSPGLALLDIVLLDVVAAATTVALAARSRLALVLMVPYLLWLGYATALNAAIAGANP